MEEGWEYDILEQVMAVFSFFKSKLERDVCTAEDVEMLESFVFSINNFEKQEVHDKGVELIRILNEQEALYQRK